MPTNNGSVTKGIKDSMALLAFAKSHGRMQIGEFENKETGEHFKSCIFTHPKNNSRVFVAFSSKLGELTPREIVKNIENLQVVQLKSDNYILCKRGSEAWEDVNIPGLDF